MRRSGFTLIELIMVIVILGILAAIALPKFADLTDKANEAAEAGVYGGVRAALAVYYADALVNNYPESDRYPGSLENINVTPGPTDPDDFFSGILRTPVKAADNWLETAPNEYDGPNIGATDNFGYTYTPSTGLFTKDAL